MYIGIYTSTYSIFMVRIPVDEKKISKSYATNGVISSSNSNSIFEHRTHQPEQRIHHHINARRSLIGYILSVFFMRQVRLVILPVNSVCMLLYLACVCDASDMCLCAFSVWYRIDVIITEFHGLTVWLLCVGTGTFLCMIVCQWCDYDTWGSIYTMHMYTSISVNYWNFAVTWRPIPKLPKTFFKNASRN